MGDEIGQETPMEHESPNPEIRRQLREFADEVHDATLLMDYGVATGAGPSEQPIPDKLIDAIKMAQDLVAKGVLSPADQRGNFEKAYRDLSRLMAPVTAATLKATSEEHGVRSALSPMSAKPVSIVWSRKLSAWSILFVSVALLGNWFETLYGPLPQGGQEIDTWPPFWECVQYFLEIAVPFTYGAIGACVSLLKACQAYIHKRQFDPRRIPEYYNRMILGAVSGGVIVLLVQHVAGPDSATIKIGVDALGFVAGYNSDLLFNAVERISEALLPKIGVESLRRAQPQKAEVTHVEIGDVSLSNLIDRLKEATTDEEKKLYTGLIEKIQNRIA